MFPPFLEKDWQIGYSALKDGYLSLSAKVREWFERNRINDGVPVTVAGLLGWAERVLVDESGLETAEYDLLASPLGLLISGVIRDECRRTLGRTRILSGR